MEASWAAEPAGGPAGAPCCVEGVRPARASAESPQLCTGVGPPLRATPQEGAAFWKRLRKTLQASGKTAASFGPTGGQAQGRVQKPEGRWKPTSSRPQHTRDVRWPGLRQAVSTRRRGPEPQLSGDQLSLHPSARGEARAGERRSDRSTDAGLETPGTAVSVRKHPPGAPHLHLAGPGVLPPSAENAMPASRPGPPPRGLAAVENAECSCSEVGVRPWVPALCSHRRLR